MDYELRFFRGPVCDCLYVTAAPGDDQALARARAQLDASADYTHAEVRRERVLLRHLEKAAPRALKRALKRPFGHGFPGRGRSLPRNPASRVSLKLPSKEPL